MCPHRHRYDPLTGHGWSAVSTEWKENDIGLATLIRALDEMETLSTEEYECDKCKNEEKQQSFRDSAFDLYGIREKGPDDG